MRSTASYAIDAGGTILWTDAGFAELARTHGRPDLADGAVGHPLTQFVAGERPRQLQESLIERARAAAGEPFEIRYRCDAPEMRRFAVLRIEAQPDGVVVFSTWFEAIEERPHLPLLDDRLPRGDGVVQLCAWCNRLDVGGWREAEDAVKDMALGNLPSVEHSVCEICELLLASRPAGGRRSSGPHDAR